MEIKRVLNIFLKFIKSRELEGYFQPYHTKGGTKYIVTFDLSNEKVVNGMWGLIKDKKFNYMGLFGNGNNGQNICDKIGHTKTDEEWTKKHLNKTGWVARTAGGSGGGKCLFRIKTINN